MTTVRDVRLGGVVASQFIDEDAARSADQPAVLMVHGWMGNRRDIVMTAAAEGAAQAGWASYSVDMPGHGERAGEIARLRPWEFGAELVETIQTLADQHERVAVLGCSLGSFMLLSALTQAAESRGEAAIGGPALLVAPLVDMEAHIERKMHINGITEARLNRERRINLPKGDALDREYLRYVRKHPVDPGVPVQILYGARDEITPQGDIGRFAARVRAGVTTIDAGHSLETPQELGWVTRWTRRMLLAG